MTNDEMIHGHLLDIYSQIVTAWHWSTPGCAAEPYMLRLLDVLEEFLGPQAIRPGERA